MTVVESNIGLPVFVNISEADRVACANGTFGHAVCMKRKFFRTHGLNKAC